MFKYVSGLKYEVFSALVPLTVCEDYYFMIENIVVEKGYFIRRPKAFDLKSKTPT